MFGIFKRRRRFGDQEKIEFVDAIASLLELQKILASDCDFVSDDGRLNSMALGYVYGFVDAALWTIGQNMGDVAIGIPIMYQVLRRICPSDHEKCLEFLVARVSSDSSLAVAATEGGQQYLDLNNRKLGVAMGLAKYLLFEPGSEPTDGNS